MNAVQLTHLSGDDFCSALISGIHRVIDEQEYLNQINVFPIADGDTGMPSYEGVLSATQINSLVLYIQSLKN